MGWAGRHNSVRVRKIKNQIRIIINCKRSIHDRSKISRLIEWVRRWAYFLNKGNNKNTITWAIITKASWHIDSCESVEGQNGDNLATMEYFIRVPRRLIYVCINRLTSAAVTLPLHNNLDGEDCGVSARRLIVPNKFLTYHSWNKIITRKLLVLRAIKLFEANNYCKQ